MEIDIHIRTTDPAEAAQVLMALGTSSATTETTAAAPEGIDKELEKKADSGTAAAPVAVTPAPAPLTPPTTQEMQDLMRIALTRVCGTPNFEESTDPRVIELRNNCASCFKELAQRLGAPRPTALEGDARIKFINLIDKICYDETKGTVVYPF